MEEINKNNKQTIDFESIKIQDLDLSISTYSCLLYANIRDLSRLISMPEEDLRNVKNMGPLSFKEIMQKVERKCNSLGFTLNEAKELQRKKNSEKAMEIVDFSRISLDDLELSSRSHNGLVCMNIHNLAELILVSEERLLKVRRLGPKSLEEIKMKVKKKLDERGLTLEEAKELQQKRDEIKPAVISFDPYVSHRRLQRIREVEKLEAELIERAEARRLQRMRGEQNAEAGKVDQKEQMLQMFEEKIVTLLRSNPCRDFTKNSQSYEDIAKTVEDFLNETLDTEMQKAQSEEEVLLIQETLEEMREIFKKIVDSKRKNITLEEKKFAASDIEKYKNTELKKYRKKQPNIMDPTFDVDAHNYNPFSDTDELGL